MRWFRKQVTRSQTAPSPDSGQAVVPGGIVASGGGGAPEERFEQPRTSILCQLRSVAELSLVESVLAGTGIPYGTAGQTGMGAWNDVAIFVRSDDLPRARALLASLNLPTEVTPADAPGGLGTEARPVGGDEG